MKTELIQLNQDSETEPPQILRVNITELTSTSITIELLFEHELQLSVDSDRPDLVAIRFSEPCALISVVGNNCFRKNLLIMVEIPPQVEVQTQTQVLATLAT